jgi:hypothetical protein
LTFAPSPGARWIARMSSAELDHLPLRRRLQGLVSRLLLGEAERHEESA